VTVVACGTRTGLPQPDPIEESAAPICHEYAPSPRFVAREIRSGSLPSAANGGLESGDYELTSFGLMTGTGAPGGKVSSGERSGRMIIDANEKTIAFVIVDGRGSPAKRATYDYELDGTTIKLTPRCGADAARTVSYTHASELVMLYWNVDSVALAESWMRAP